MSFEEQLKQAWGEGTITAIHFEVALLRLTAAAALAALVAYRPWRRLLRNVPRVAIETREAQVLLAIAGSVVILVIGDSLARAFAIGGLGGFIRFRSGIKDPRDAAVLFLLIGLGMACGLGLVAIAVLSTAFLVAVLFALDISGRPITTRCRLALMLDPWAVDEQLIRRAFPVGRILSLPAVGTDPAEVRLEAEFGQPPDAAKILADLRARGIQGVRRVSIEEEHASSNEGRSPPSLPSKESTTRTPGRFRRSLPFVARRRANQ